MLWDEAVRSPLNAYIYLERYVNEGSPSGFTFRNGVTPQYSPLDGDAQFDLPVFLLPKETVTSFGDLDAVDVLRGSDKGVVPVPVHPDMLVSLSGAGMFSKVSVQHIKVAPTASQRTVYWNGNGQVQPFFIKLHYPKKIGRFVRSIPLFKWLAAKESSHFVRSHLRSHATTFQMLDEFGGVFVEGHGGHDGFGAVFRSFPWAINPPNDNVLIPAFSLFSRDARHPEHPTLLKQLILESKSSADDVISELFEPLIRGYVDWATSSGLLPECNAQNVLFSVTPTGRISGIFIRDMEGVWKDLSVRSQLQLDCSCVRYHTIAENEDPDHYMRRSFMYDFKLGEYLLEPLVQASADALNLPRATIMRRVQDVGRCAWNRYPAYFNPKTSWFCYPRNSEVSRGAYLAKKNPRFR